MNSLLRNARPDDIPTMYTISRRAHLDSAYQALIPADRYVDFQAAYQQESVKRDAYLEKMHRHIANKKAKAWVVEVDGSVRGYTIAAQSGDL